MRRSLAASAVAGLLACSAGPQTGPIGLPAELASAIDPVGDVVWAGFDRQAAQAHVEFASDFWRLPGNAGYDATLDRVRDRLASTGAFDAGTLRFETYAGDAPAWDYSVGTLAVHASSGATSDAIVLSRETHRLALCINSFSTPAGGVVARLVDVGRGDDDDYAGLDVAGAVVLGDGSTNQLWRRAVVERGAIGVVSTSLASYISPDAPGADSTPRDSWDILQWGRVPYDPDRRAFGFKASPRAAATLRRLLAAGPVDIMVTVASSFTTNPVRTLIAEIPGQVAPRERIVAAAHVQEPGANDNASGLATLTEFVRALAVGIRAGDIPPPGRTLTFLWLDEIGGSRRWLADHPDQAASTRYMFSMDMTGEDIALTGGSFLIERWPDPAAVWERPWDPHSEWGSGSVDPDSLTGDLINDLHRAVAEHVAMRTAWIVRTNPYEGGSDHTVFGQAGIPSVLNWHFTDRYYHTNFDTPDKTSADEMRNVGVTVASSAWLMASADEAAALAVAELVRDAGLARLQLEQREGARLAAGDADPEAARAREVEILAAWRRWYAQAVDSARRLAVGPVGDDFDTRLSRIAAAFAPSR